VPTSSDCIKYTPRPDATPEGELSALVAVYRFILDRAKSKEGGPATALKDDVKESNGYVATSKHTR
jgi:hypothetical protein